MPDAVRTSPDWLMSLVVMLAPTPQLDWFDSMSFGDALPGIEPAAHTCSTYHYTHTCTPTDSANVMNDVLVSAELCRQMTTVKTTLCSEKNTHSRFLLYLRGKCFHLYKIFRVCLQELGIPSKSVIYSLLLLTRKHFIKCLFSTLP